MCPSTTSIPYHCYLKHKSNRRNVVSVSNCPFHVIIPLWDVIMRSFHFKMWESNYSLCACSCMCNYAHLCNFQVKEVMCGWFAGKTGHGGSQVLADDSWFTAELSPRPQLKRQSWPHWLHSSGTHKVQFAASLLPLCLSTVIAHL